MDQLALGKVARRRKKNAESGMTLVEVMLAGFILVVGMLGFAALMATAIAANARSRTDTTATMLTQSLMEQIVASMNKSGANPPQLKDCTGSTYSVDISAGGDALVSSSEQIDWTETTPPYQIFYEICASTLGTTANAQERTYDVRWNIQKVGTTTQSNTWLVIAGARPKNYSANLKMFALPVNMKTYITAAPF